MTSPAVFSKMYFILYPHLIRPQIWKPFLYSRWALLLQSNRLNGTMSTLAFRLKSVWWVGKLNSEVIRPNPAGINMVRVNNKNTNTMCEICSKLTLKKPERRQWRRSGVFIVNFEHILHLVMVLLLLSLNM